MSFYGLGDPLPGVTISTNGLPLGMPDFLQTALNQAKVLGYSVPYNISYAPGGGAAINFANPNNTIGWGSTTNLAQGNSNYVPGFPNLSGWLQQNNYAAVAGGAAATYQGTLSDAAAAAQAYATQQATGVPTTSASQSQNTVGHAMLQFSTSKGSGTGLTLVPGDTWTIQITGAAANSPVTVFGGKDGSYMTNSMGTTDGAGNWSKSGTAQTGDVGSWQEQWSVGGQLVGSFVFTVATSALTVPSGSTTQNPANTTGPTITTYVPTTPTGQIPVPNAPAGTSGAPSGFAIGLEALFNPSQWSAVFSSGDTMQILGLVAPLAIGAFMLKGLISKR